MFTVNMTMPKKAKPNGSLYLDPVNGYILIKHNGKWKRRNRVVMEKELKRPLEPWEHVHHKNGNRTDDRLCNLVIISASEHSRLHNTGRRASSETKIKMQQGAIRRVARPGHKQHLSKRAKAQHAAGKLGRATWGKGVAEQQAKKMKGRAIVSFTNEVRSKMRAAWTPERRAAQAKRITRFNQEPMS